MTAETFNEFGRRYGYPIYVFSDGSYAATRLYGKQVLFTVEGPIDTNPAHQRRLTSNQDKYPAPPCREIQENSGFWNKIKQKINTVFEKSEPEYADFTEVKDAAPIRKQETSPANRDVRRNPGIFTHEGKDWKVIASGVKEVKTFHAKEADKEVFVANYKF